VTSLPPRPKFNIRSNLATKIHDIIAKGTFAKIGQSSEPPATPFPAIAASGRPPSFGLPRHGLDQIALQSEMALQHIPSPTFSFQRQILVLESTRLLVLQKMRPVDYLYDVIRSNYKNKDALHQILQHLCNVYGPDQYVDRGVHASGMRHILFRPGRGYTYTLSCCLSSCMCVLLCSINVFNIDPTTNPYLTYAH